MAHLRGKSCALLQTTGSTAHPSLLILFLKARLGLPSPPLAGSQVGDDELAVCPPLPHSLREDQPHYRCGSSGGGSSGGSAGVGQTRRGKAAGAQCPLPSLVLLACCSPVTAVSDERADKGYCREKAIAFLLLLTFFIQISLHLLH